MSDCRWCRRRLADQADYDSLSEDGDGDLCWREWNSYADCHRIEESMKAAAPDLLEALEWLTNRAEWGNHNLEFGMELDKARAAIAKAKGGKP